MATDGERARVSETGRIEAFSDGVFAIATTLLIIEVHVPHGHDLGHDLLRLWPSYLGYLTSFLTIGVMWINHHHLCASPRPAPARSRPSRLPEPPGRST